ncbi:protein O-mannosyl-transferase TMTC1-like [Wyeomyia smithii]|uniref:protein O-mannosyl-transferase TMTC1-like n=1 Tax=Wyeomyia smithii TaxID=174621 RepID=UPI0024681CBD|nr:protein O-mannosyl-transferase TMTC1-like [Wyeomyia smithii]XP_055536778.1 protein O-mannosyl-transferase TMTC1-like [Wyeomyia smithii]XP_055536779.1 protein O-mannosyl-transferase TMTC1-like [Wyeomyia smithii]XP_055536780.1 protein O-mannosyl-transferase TMTC1-like [Wyeomyia smithii]XP_055536782.1 protein O-mannosyl-transferase TMTC1-like [Wyeomyia smithii]XP_055536783.1 protein O-mannosyl-transferase TMTC1-like [Wyeomyia smithii]XP_055536784.1 protein O-mannosyl-transferase TMTC1-like [W
MKRRVTIVYPPVSVSHRSSVGSRWEATTANGCGNHSYTPTSSSSSSSPSSSPASSSCSSYSPATLSASEKHTSSIEDALNNNSRSSNNHAAWCNGAAAVHSTNSSNQHDSQKCNFNKNCSGHLVGCGCSTASVTGGCTANSSESGSSSSSTSSSSSSSSSSGHTSGKYRKGMGAACCEEGTDDWRVYFFVGLIAVLCYLNGVQGDFVHDDIPAITMNKDVLGLSPVSQVFRNDFWGAPMADLSSHKSYRPLTTLTFRLNYITFGLRSLWFHATNVVLHAAACVLFTRVCTTIARLRKNFAVFAGVLFAVHPIHTEAVTGIVGRADVLACIFFLISLLAYHGHNDEPDSNSLWLSILFGGLSMLAKETGITVFLLNVAYDVYRNWASLKKTILHVRWSEETHQFGRRVSRVLLSMGVLLAVRLALLQGSLPKFSQQDNPTAFHPNLYVRLLTFCYLAAFNWWLLLCPSTLSHDWQMGSIPLVTSISDPRNLLTFIAFFAAILLVCRGILDFEHQRHVPVVLGFLLLVLPFLPATNLVVTVGFVIAERVLYIPSMGSVILTVYGAQQAWERLPNMRKPILAFCILLFASGCLKTLSRNLDWSSREALLRSGLKTLPHNAKMHYNFGNFLRDSAQPDQAIAHYREALRLWPTYASAHNNIGTLMGELETAEYHFLEAIKYSSEHINAHYNLGQLYRKANRTADAIRMLERCITLEPLSTAAYLELVKLYSGSKVGQLLRRVVLLNPYDADLHRHYGDWLAKQNLLLEAIVQYQEGLRIVETHQLSVIGACRTLRKLGQRSRLHQLILRWQFIVRLSNGGIPIQTEIYLRDWSIKHELRNRAMVYDTGGSAHGATGSGPGSSSGGGGELNDVGSSSMDAIAVKDCSSTLTAYDGCRSTTTGGPVVGPSIDPEISIRILRAPHCNRSEHLPGSLKHCKTIPNTASSPPVKPSSSNSSRSKATRREDSGSGSTSAAGAKNKKWPKSRHKHKGSPASSEQLEPNSEGLAPLLVSNLLDKL